MTYTEEQFQAVLDERKEIVERIGSENTALRQRNYALKAAVKRLLGQGRDGMLPAAHGSASSVLAEIVEEIERATAKFPTWPTRAIDAFAVVGEEFGECQKEVMQLTYEPQKSKKDYVRKEAVQLAAMSIRFLMSLDRYEYTPGPQHSHQNKISDG